jgi:iron complex outermembrane receptor protein
MLEGVSIRARLMTAAAIAVPALLSAQPANAQSSGNAEPSTAINRAEPASGLSEIIVTAQRRAENLQDVPIAVSAVTADMLAQSGVDTSRDLPQIVPSVQLTRSGPSGLFFIRGVGTTNAAAGEEGANAFYVDGVYLGDLSQTINNFNSIERVEVLKGPQGTLFGRNATGGLIHIITREPGQEARLDGKIGYSNYSTVDAQVYAAVPISDTISADVALTSKYQRDGWGRNLTRDTKNGINEYRGIRSKLVARPLDTLKLTLSGDYFSSADNLGLGWRLADGTVGTGGTVGPGGHDTTANHDALTKLRLWGVSLTGALDLGFADLTSITALRRTSNNSRFDVDGGPLNLVNIEYLAKGRTFQQELRLASTSSGPLTWQAGLFYLYSRASTDQNQNGDAFAAQSLREIDIISSLTTRSYAAFGELTYAITPTTTVTGGLRYTQDVRDFDGTQTPTLLTGAVLPTTTVLSRLKYSEFTYRAALRQELAEDVSLYASINRGFKAGTYSLQSPTSPPVNPQFIMAYEAGIKSELLDRRLRLNVSAYHYDIDDYQVRSAAAANPGANILLNAATVKVDGLEAEFEALIVDGFRVFGGANLLRSKYQRFGGPDSDFQAPISYPRPATCPPSLVGTADPGVLLPGPRTGGLATCFGDVSGNYTPLASKFAASLGGSYTFDVGQTGSLRLSALYNYNSGYVFEPDNVARQASFHLLNGSIEYRPSEQVGIEFWASNLTDTEYVVQDLSTATGVTEVLAPPRTYGVNLKFNF